MIQRMWVSLLNRNNSTEFLGVFSTEVIAIQRTTEILVHRSIIPDNFMTHGILRETNTEIIREMFLTLVNTFNFIVEMFPCDVE